MASNRAEWLPSYSIDQLHAAMNENTPFTREDTEFAIDRLLLLAKRRIGPTGKPLEDHEARELVSSWIENPQPHILAACEMLSQDFRQQIVFAVKQGIEKMQ